MKKKKNLDKKQSKASARSLKPMKSKLNGGQRSFLYFNHTKIKPLQQNVVLLIP